MVTQRDFTKVSGVLFLLDQDEEDGGDQEEPPEDDGEDVQDFDGAAESDWDSLAFEPRKSFSPCTTPYCKEKNFAHTHSVDRCFKLHPQKGKKGGSKGSSSLLFTKGRCLPWQCTAIAVQQYN